MIPFRSGKFRHGVAIAVTVAGLTWFLEHKGWFDSLEGVAFDFQHNLWSPGSGESSAKIVVVDIDDISYGSCFGGTSPLNEETVLDLVRNVRSVSGPGPKVIGVDLLTESAKYSDLYSHSEFDPCADNRAQVIWAAVILLGWRPAFNLAGWQR